MVDFRAVPAGGAAEGQESALPVGEVQGVTVQRNVVSPTGGVGRCNLRDFDFGVPAAGRGQHEEGNDETNAMFHRAILTQFVDIGCPEIPAAAPGSPASTVSFSTKCRGLGVPDYCRRLAK